MKTTIKISFLMLITLLLNTLNPQTTIAQCHNDDWTALKALYESTDGDNWINRNGWGTVLGDNQPANCNLENLYGIHLTNGRVTCIDLDGDDNCEYDYDEGGNNLMGSIPSQLDNLAYLNWLSLSYNFLNGSIPSNFGNFTDLAYLNLSYNNLSGGVPSELGNLSNLIELNLGQNPLQGSIPIEIGDLNNLEILSLFKNQLTGDIPHQIGNLTNLTHLYINGNELDNSIPSEIGNLTNLTWIRLDFNKLSGSIPAELGNLSNLKVLHLEGNKLNGVLPVELGNLNSLTYMRLDYNKISGMIPSQLGNLSNINNLSLDGNEFSGSIPPELGNLTGLRSLQLQYNKLSGNIPEELGNLNDLTTLDLHYNMLEGNIPIELSYLTKLETLQLQANNLSGSIPAEFGNLDALKTFWLNGNEITGVIPPELSNLTSLKKLIMSGNQLQGSIPAEFSNLLSLERLEVSHNNLVGCYDNNLAILCNRLTSNWFDGDADISDGNNFIATWEDFCTTGAGSCDGEPFCGCTDPTACNYNPNATCDDGSCHNNCCGCTDPTACNYNPDATCDNGSCLQNCPANNVYPGDLNHDGIVNNQDISLSGLFLYFSGLPRAGEHQNTNWFPYPSVNWGILNNQNKDIKHHDCDGNGVIDENDQQAVEDNLGFTWKPVDPPPSPPESDYQVMLHPIDQVYDGNLVMNVALERRAGGDLTLQGGHFTVDYSDIEGNFNNVVLNFEPISWLGTPNINLWYESIHFSEEKKIEVGFTKTNHTDSEGSGIIGKLILEYNGSAKRSNISYNFEVNTIGVHQSNGNFLPVEDQQLKVNLNSTCQPNLTIGEDAPFQNLYQSSNNIITNGFVLIGAGQEVVYNAKRVRINGGFSVKAGSEFKVRSTGCN